MPRIYDLKPSDLTVLREGSPLRKFQEFGVPLASIRGPAATGNNPMRVPIALRPRGWNIHPVTLGRGPFPGDIPLVPECTNPFGVADWAFIQAAIRVLTTCDLQTIAADAKLLASVKGGPGA